MTLYEDELQMKLQPALIGAVLALSLVLLMETLLAAYGFVPSPKDTPGRWAAERQRASQLGEQAFIIVGTSRGLIDLDTHVLAEATGKTTVQLAIDGSTYEAVLADLAADPSIRGSILVTHNDAFMLRGEDGEADRASEYTAYARKMRSQGLLQFLTSAWTGNPPMN